MTDSPYALHPPNLRSLYLPDPGHVLVEADLARADAQVIAWEAGATKLKEALRDDLDIHSSNAQLLYGTSASGATFRHLRDVSPRAMHSNGMSYRDNAKRWVHATNFGGRARTVASAIVVPERHVEACQHWWTRVEHPEIGAFHDKLEFDLRSRKNPAIYNRFGFRRLYVGGDRTSNLLGQSLAWIAQSTVAVVINHAMLAVDCARDLLGKTRCGVCLKCRYSWVHLLLQVHDSLLLEIPSDRLCPSFISSLNSAMSVEIPYEDSLTIGCEIKWSADSWGHMRPWRGSKEDIAA